MLIKLIGAASVFSVSVFAGFFAANTLILREKSLKSFCDALTILKSEIGFSGNYMGNALKNIAELVDNREFFDYAAEKTYTSGARKAWLDALDAFKDKLYLTAKDVNILSSLAAELGTTDRENQLNSIDYVLSMLCSAKEEAYMRSSSLVKIYRSIGISTGLILVILLF